MTGERTPGTGGSPRRSQGPVRCQQCRLTDCRRRWHSTSIPAAYVLPHRAELYVSGNAAVISGK